MKKHLLTLITGITLSVFAIGQSASNFSCNDCDAVSHDLFSELNSGKVIVISWIMPCGSCIAPTQAAYAAVQSFA